MGKISTFAVRLQRLLEIKGITKAELSRITGINKSSLTHYVKGDWEGKQDAVYAIARATGVSEAWLMGYDVPMTQEESRKQEIAQKMKNFRIMAGLTQSQAAEKLGIAFEAICNYEQGIDRIEPHVFNAMCSYYDVAPKSVLSPDEETEMFDALFEMMMSRLRQGKKETPPYSSEALRLAGDYDWLDEHGKRMVRLVANEEKARLSEEHIKARATALQAKQEQPEPDKVVYITNWFPMPMSAGTGQPAGSDEPEELELTKRPPRGTSYIAPVSGDSMEPTYCDGDKLFIRACEEIEVGQIGVFLMDGQQWVKEVGDGILISHNPEYAPITMRDNIKCQGLVLGVCDGSYFDQN